MMAFCKVARSSRNSVQPLSRLAYYLAPRSFSQCINSSIPLTRNGIVAPRLAGLDPRCALAPRATSGFCWHRVSGTLFSRSFWGSGGSWMRNTRKELEWARPRRKMFGGFGGSGIRHFGGGGYIDPQLVLGGLIAANVGVFFLWRTMDSKFMNTHFVVSAEALRSGRLHTLVTSAFSQYELHHLLSNMIGLYFFGSEIGRIFGGQKLLLLYLTGGVVGALSHVAYWAYLKPWLEGYSRRFQRFSPGLLGSSGAVNAIILLDILLFPKRIIYFNMIIPIPAALFGLVIVGSDLWAATDGNRHGTSPAAHLGGAAAGVVAYLMWRF